MVFMISAILLVILIILLNICYRLIKINKYMRNLVFQNALITKYCLVRDVVFYVPYAPEDFIQRRICLYQHFYEEEELNEIKHYIPENAVILDIGANIGNHSLYWASKCRVNKIYAFEPVPETFNILRKNVENNFPEKIKILNIGLSDVSSHAAIKNFGHGNIGATVIEKSENGLLQVDKLDNLSIEEEHIDFVKIDVEGHEIFTLRGGVETLKKHKPVVFIEMWHDNFKQGHKILTNLGYKLKKQTSKDNYLYIHE